MAVRKGFLRRNALPEFVVPYSVNSRNSLLLNSPLVRAPGSQRRPRSQTLYPATSNKPDDDYHHNDHQNNMNQAAANVKRETQKPQYQQDYRNSPKHRSDNTFRSARRSSLLFCEYVPMGRLVAALRNSHFKGSGFPWQIKCKEATISLAGQLLVLRNRTYEDHRSANNEKYKRRSQR